MMSRVHRCSETCTTATAGPRSGPAVLPPTPTRRSGARWRLGDRRLRRGRLGDRHLRRGRRRLAGRRLYGYGRCRLLLCLPGRQVPSLPADLLTMVGNAGPGRGVGRVYAHGWFLSLDSPLRGGALTIVGRRTTDLSHACGLYPSGE